MLENNAGFQVEEVRWSACGDEIYALRCEVFVVEQKCPLDEELDGRDPGCRHVVARAGARIIACGRLSAEGVVGRMAVAAAWRGRGVGMAVLRELVRLARQAGVAEVVLSAQSYAIPFYGRLGFQAEGEEYLDANIPHRTMRLRLH